VGRLLEGVRVLDMAHVQSGASCASRCVTSPTSTASTSPCSGCPIKLSDSPVDVHRSPLLGDTNEDIYGRELGRDNQLASLKAKGVICRIPQ
jgi:crotonobetainyl-CoA:carnitine CoA-transferase CaiB-like acyl-CoA transferase